MLVERKTRKKVLIVLACLLFVGLMSIKGWRAWKAHKVWARSSANVNCANCYKDLEYVPGSTDPFQSLDLYIPKKPKFVPMPLIIWIHGGAWVSGDKNHPPAQLVLDRGYAIASINYRLTNKTAFPAQVYDCKAAVRFLRAKASEYKLDPERFGLWGQSAGGHLVALLGTSCDVKELEGDLGYNDVSSRVQAVADWCGPTDLVTVAEQAPANCRIDFKSPTNPVALLLHDDQSQKAYRSASPVTYVRADNPPFYILHAEDDDIVPVGQAREFCEALKKASAQVECHISPTGGHGLLKQEFIDEVMHFFDRTLSNDKAPQAVNRS